MRPRSIAGYLLVAGAAAGLMATAGCKPLPPSKPESQFTTQEVSGQQVYRTYCAKCHYPNNTHSLHGPGLQAVTKVKAMPSGAPPTDERLSRVILHGRNMMPATQLSDEQLQDLLAYLHTL